MILYNMPHHFFHRPAVVNTNITEPFHVTVDACNRYVCIRLAYPVNNLFYHGRRSNGIGQKNHTIKYIIINQIIDIKFSDIIVISKYATKCNKMDYINIFLNGPNNIENRKFAFALIYLIDLIFWILVVGGV